MKLLESRRVLIQDLTLLCEFKIIIYCYYLYLLATVIFLTITMYYIIFKLFIVNTHNENLVLNIKISQRNHFINLFV